MPLYPVPSPLVSVSLFLLRHRAGARPLIGTLIAVANFAAGRIAPELPTNLEIGLTVVALLSIPVVFVCLSADEDLRARAVRSLLRRADSSLAALARSRQSEDFDLEMKRHYGAWLAPGMLEAIRQEAHRRTDGPLA